MSDEVDRLRSTIDTADVTLVEALRHRIELSMRLAHARRTLGGPAIVPSEDEAPLALLGEQVGSALIPRAAVFEVYSEGVLPVCRKCIDAYFRAFPLPKPSDAGGKG